jgi:GntR family transcriptional regulator
MTSIRPVPTVATPLPVPRYHQIYLLLRERLAAGEFSGGAALPGELHLAREYRVSRVTLRAALNLLVQEKLILRQRGRGTFARPGDAPPAGPPLLGLLENLVAMGLKTSVRVLALSNMPASPDVAEGLRIAPGEMVQRAVRIRSHRGGPVSHLTTYVPLAVAKFRRRVLAAKPMLQLLEESGVKVAGAEQTVSAKLAEPSIAALLDVEVGAPLLAVTRVVHDHAGRRVQLLRGLYRPDRYQYRMQLSRRGDDVPRIWVSNDAIHTTSTSVRAGRGHRPASSQGGP